jgi:hypothetical protein
LFGVAGGDVHMTFPELALANGYTIMAVMVVALGGRFAPGRTLEQLLQLMPAADASQSWFFSEVSFTLLELCNKELAMCTAPLQAV